MQAVCIGKTKESLNGLISCLTISEKLAEEDTFGASCHYQCLVAAKVLYFGVGDGVLEFLKGIERRKGRVMAV